MLLIMAMFALSAVAAGVRRPVKAGSIGLTVSTSVLEYTGDNFTASWTNNASPSKGDWIGLWQGAAWPNGTYMAYVEGVSGPDGTATSGSQTFSAYNMRLGPYYACFYPGSAGTHMDPPLECAGPVSFAQGGLEATHIRLQLAPSPSSMLVMFVSNTSVTPMVTFWPKGREAEARTAFGSSETYTQDDLCSPPDDDGMGAWIDPGYIHTVSLDGLAPSTEYVYRAGHSASALSAPRAFASRRDAPGPGAAPAYPLRFNVYADQEYLQPFCPRCATHATFPPGPGAQALATSVAASEVPAGSAFAAHIGDLGYALNYALVWELFAQTNAPAWGAMPVAVSVGNHEYDSPGTGGPAGPTWHPPFGNQGDDSRGECGVPTMHRFRGVPSQGSNSIFWYSFNYGPLHFAMITAEVDLSPGSPQYQWLAADLASVDRAATPWLFVGCHRPIYNNEDDASDHAFSLGLRPLLEPLLLRHSVDVLFSGHYHSYLRTAPVRNGTVAEDAGGWAAGTTHLTVGTAGIGFDSTDWLPRAWDRRHYARIFAFGRVTLLNETAMAFELVDSFNGTVLDSHTLRSNHTFPEIAW